MTNSETAAALPASVEEMQRGWHELTLRVQQLEIESGALEQENKVLRRLLERALEHRQKSHTELVLLLTTLVSKLPLNDIGTIVSRLVEHNTNASQYTAALIKGTADADLPQPEVLKTLDHAKRDLAAALKPAVEELLLLDPPYEKELLQGLLKEPDLFFSSRVVRANRCFIKGQVPRERIAREFGEPALVCFNDMTTDPKLNPHPKPEEIVLSFRNDFEQFWQQNPSLLPDKRQELQSLYEKVQRSKAATEQARTQKTAFQKLSFLIELLHYYEHQNTEAPDVVFAQRLPALVEQLVLGGTPDNLDEKQIAQAEALLAYIISPDHRQMVINNVGKAGGTPKTLKYVLRLRADKVPQLDEVLTDFTKHLIPAAPQSPPTAEGLAAVLRLIHLDMQRLMLKSLQHTDRIRREEAEALTKAAAGVLGLQGLIEELKAQAAVPPETARRLAWNKVKDQLFQRQDPATIAASIRDRLHAFYDAEEIRESWLALIESEPLLFIKVFCHLPYLADGRTDPIARTVMEVYVTRLLHEKYATAYHKVLNSLRNMYKAKPDSPTLVNFVTLVRWVSPEAAAKVGADIGMPAAA